MKFNKKAILATAGVVAGVLAPAASVFAAGGYAVDGTAGSAGLPLPVYTSNSANASAGSAVAYSVASVVIKTGFLSIDKVPNLHFTNSYEGATTDLMDNAQGTGSAGQDFDGNADGILQVTDSRKASGSGNTKVPMNGWKLQASLGKFVLGDGSDGSAASAWTLTLNRGAAAQKVVDAGSRNFDPTGFNSTLEPTGASTAALPVHLPSATSGTPTTVEIWTAATGTGAGITKAFYNSAMTANLKIPMGVANGSYSAPITWTLTAGI